MKATATTGLLFDATERFDKSATFSLCGLYRYTLSRRWGDGPACNFLMLNPSTADASVSDPTVTRCVNFARAWGYPALVVTNLFAFRATDPKVMMAAADPVGPMDDAFIVAKACQARITVCAWGNHGSLGGRATHVAALLTKFGVTPQALRVTGQGMPSHPLYLPANLTPIPWSPR